MPLRDVEKEAVLIGRRWLHDLVFADWGLKLVAFAVAFGLWLAVTGQRAPATARLRNVALHFLLPPEMEIGNEPREQVDVILRGSRRVLNALRAGDVVLTYDAGAHRPGERIVRLTPANVTLELPQGVNGEGLTVERVEPANVPLRLERRVERQVEVRPRIEGKLAEGYELQGVEVRPSLVRVRGPEGHVNELETAPTELISVEGRTENFVAQQTAIDIGDRKVVPLDAAVDVFVRIGEPTAERSLDSIPVVLPEGAQGEPQPARAAVTVRGPRSVVQSLRAGDLSILLEPAGDGQVRARLRLPAALEGRVEMLSTQPQHFTVKSY
ncbi:MAG TPA: CdaR family protein [Pyrinomonadaceae bacterium]|nr:CdaR family protein [Pyrinomonadaceae bacterium]